MLAFPGFPRSAPPEVVCPATLYHFTSPQAAESIVTSGLLRATELALHPKDVQEIEYGMDLAGRVLRREATSADCKSYVGALNLGLAEFQDFGKTDAMNAFAACFSYADDPYLRRFGPVALQFCDLVFDGRLTFTCSVGLRYVTIRRVLYEESGQEAELRRVLSNWEKVCRTYEAAGWGFIPDSFVEQALTPWLYSVKRPEFASEKEWRIIVLPKMTDWWETFRDVAHVHKTRTGRYIELALKHRPTIL